MGVRAHRLYNCIIRGMRRKTENYLLFSILKPDYVLIVRIPPDPDPI